MTYLLTSDYKFPERERLLPDSDTNIIIQDASQIDGRAGEGIECMVFSLWFVAILSVVF